MLTLQIIAYQLLKKNPFESPYSCTI